MGRGLANRGNELDGAGARRLGAAGPLNEAGKAQSEIAKIERGRRQPTFATVERLVRAAGFDLRIHLTPHDDHDDVLIEQMLARTPEERLATLEVAADFFASVPRQRI